MLSTVAFINKLKSLQNIKAVKVLILDDTNEDKKGKKIEGVCDNIWSNKDKKTIRVNYYENRRKLKLKN